MVGVNNKDDLANAQAFAASSRLVLDSWYHPDQQVAAQFAATGPVALPTTLLLKSQHRVAARYFGPITSAVEVGS